jgi:hypothetical protein
VTLPTDGAPSSSAVYWSTRDASGYTRLFTSEASGLASAKVTHFSTGFVGSEEEADSSTDGGLHDGALGDAEAGDASRADGPADGAGADAPTDAHLDATTDSGPEATTDSAPDASCPAPDGGVVTLSSGGAPYGIVVNSSYLFWADLSGKVLRMSLEDCSIATIASGQSGSVGVTLAGANVYWTNNNGGGGAGSIVTAPQAGGTPITLASGLEGPGLPTTDGTNVYWTPGSSDYAGVVYQMAITGGAIQSLASENFSQDILAVGGLVYWTDELGSDVAYVPADGGTVVTVASAQTIPYYMATDGVNVYWTNSIGGDAGAVMKVAVGADAGAPVEIAAAPDGPTGVASDGTNVYFNNGTSIEKVGVNGGAVTTLIVGPTTLARIAVDAKNIYGSPSSLVEA